MPKTTLHHVSTILWDWNGTLLDDISISINAINQLLSDRNLSRLNNETYREVFTFPVKKYYESVGFDFQREDWDEVAHQFIGLYEKGFSSARLFPGVDHILNHFQASGFQQFMISAMEHELLKRTVEHLGIREYFENISGIHDHFASSKSHMAIDFIEKQNIDPEKACMIGDTLHDHEVAIALGVDCVLVASGHQSFNRLQKSGCLVVADLHDLKSVFQLNGSQFKQKQ